jgi:hypothetical protein
MMRPSGWSRRVAVRHTPEVVCSYNWASESGQSANGQLAAAAQVSEVCTDPSGIRISKSFQPITRGSIM